MSRTFHPRKELPIEHTKQILERYKDADVLTPALKKEQALFDSVVCPSCGKGDLIPVLDERRPFVEGNYLPRKLLKCACGAVVEPYTGLLVEGRKK